MDGRIAFTSEQNAGTTFCVDLPAWTGEVSSSRDIRFSNVVDISRTGEGDTLLYVEDNPANMNRFEVPKILKAAPSTRDIPETALSAAAMPRGTDAGFTNYPANSVNLREFLAAVDSLLTEPTRDRHRN